ncbi:MAG: 1-acyl-sn-glycerol-3-phosphate acyltransferase [Oscillospiraceae bacterium]|nr:1-acyl-sn-glycerol-3-phosphate acyltransferase [Candidatus Limimonas coprohippi]
MQEQIITNKDRLKFYSEKEYNFNWDKPLKEKPLTYKIFYPIAKLVCNYKFDVEYHGTENLPKNGGFMMACNHVAGLDPIAIMYVTYREHNARTLFFMAKEEFFHVFYVKLPLLFFGGFPVKRGTSDRKSLDYSIRIIKEGFGLLVFPEGTRNKERTRPSVDAKAGVALIAREAKADVLPVSIHMEPRKEKYNGKGGKPKYIIRFGEVIKYEDLGLGDKPKSKELKSATKLIMEKICEEWDKDVIE